VCQFEPAKRTDACLSAPHRPTQATETSRQKQRADVCEGGFPTAGKLGGITARVVTCRRQIDAIAASKQKATTVLSSSKYPAGPALADFRTLFVAGAGAHEPPRPGSTVAEVAAAASRRKQVRRDFRGDVR
jgi:hypothetical protein